VNANQGKIKFPEIDGKKSISNYEGWNVLPQKDSATHLLKIGKPQQAEGIHA